VKLAILSQDPKLHSTARLIEAAKSRGHDVRVLNYLRSYINVAVGKSKVWSGTEEFATPDAMIPRIGASYTFHGTTLVRQFEHNGVFTTATSEAILCSRDKLRCMQVLALAGIQFPESSFGHSPEDTDGLLQVLGEESFVIKLIEGTQGIGVILSETKKSAKSVIEALRGLSANILVQRFVEEAGGEDIRAFVIGDRVVAAMRRKAAASEFRANLHRGGKSEAVELSEEEKEIAVRSSKAAGLSISGVDFLRSRKGPLVLEINSSPGLQGIENASGVDIASLIVEFIEKQLETFVCRYPNHHTN
jgi:ribosomal protein S6--L-glutamate ligase